MKVCQKRALQPNLAEQQVKQKYSKSCLFYQERCGRVGTMGNLVLSLQPDPAAIVSQPNSSGPHLLQCPVQSMSMCRLSEIDVNLGEHHS